MDMLVLERAPLGAIRNGYLDTSGCRLLPRGTKHYLLGAPEEFRQRIRARPRKVAVYNSAFPAEMQTQIQIL